jgi:hypothetical protein
VSGTAECKTIILKKGGLAYALKKAIEFVEQYNNTTFYTTVTADTYAAQKVVDNVQSRCNRKDNRLKYNQRKCVVFYGAVGKS